VEPDASDYPRMEDRFACCVPDQQTAGPQPTTVLAYYKIDPASGRLQVTHELNLMVPPPRPLVCAVKVIVDRTDPGLLAYDEKHQACGGMVGLEFIQGVDPMKDRKKP